ncbi:hypothetical protein NMY22_g8777 [Coprinellus aureogranulatus]|nr:hypothetical protein NMY22_g8777 [Coprinellus aureogranulatus]
MSVRSRLETRRLLDEVERGSIPCIRKLDSEWPQSIEDSKSALRILLRHFVNHVHAIPGVESSLPIPTATLRTITLIRACIIGMDGAFLFISNARQDHREQMLLTLQEHLESYLAWLVISSRRSTLFFPTDPVYVGIHLANNKLCNLFQFNTIAERPFLAGNPCVEKIVDYVLWLWTDGITPLDLSEVLVEAYGTLFTSRASVVMVCAMNEVSRDFAVQKVDALDRYALTNLASNFSNCLREWADVYRSAYRQAPSSVSGVIPNALVLSASVLSTSTDRLSQALRKAGFYTLAAGVGLEFRDLPLDYGASGVHPFGVMLHSTPMSSALPRARNILNAIPDLLENNLLDIMLLDLEISARPGEITPYYRWDVRDKPTGLQTVLRIGHHPRIARSLSAGFAKVREEQLLAPVVAKHWNEFVKDIHAYMTALSALDEKSETRALAVCDSLEHHPPATSSHFQQAKKCSWCRSVMYCSRECQKRDWKALHRWECAGMRVHRIDLKLQGLYDLRSTRIFQFLILKARLEQALPKLPIAKGYAPGGGSGEARVYFVDQVHWPPKYGAVTVPDTLAWYDPESGELPFTGDRAKQLLRQYEADNENCIQLACSTALLGQFLFATIATFLIRRGRSDLGGKEECQIDFLNGHVAVLYHPTKNIPW